MNTELSTEQTLIVIAGKVGRLEVLQEGNLRSISELTTSVNRLVDKLEKSDDTARDADQRARAAHHRIDKVEADLKEARSAHEAEIKEMRAGQRWLIGIMISSIGLFLAAVGVIWKVSG